METINGDYAIAWGAIEAGVSVFTGYPGSPGTGIFNVLSETKLKFGHKTQWCLNERIALESRQVNFWMLNFAWAHP